jgi:hypothetical protein
MKTYLPYENLFVELKRIYQMKRYWSNRDILFEKFGDIYYFTNI